MTLKRFLIHLLFLGAFISTLVFAVLMWLRIYTNHGQELELPNYIGMQVDKATKDADERSFVIMVNDSTHRVGIPGGQIVEQNPKPFSKVKEKRKIYVTITKYKADQTNFSDFRPLYGRDYHRKKKELGYEKIYTKIKDYKFDSGAADHVLEVWYKDQLIADHRGKKSNIMVARGDTLEFVLSKKGGAEFPVPDLRCSTINSAEFNLNYSGLKLGDISNQGEITDETTAIISDQYPTYETGATITMGEKINITITQVDPNCY